MFRGYLNKKLTQFLHFGFQAGALRRNFNFNSIYLTLLRKEILKGLNMNNHR